MYNIHRKKNIATRFFGTLIVMSANFMHFYVKLFCAISIFVNVSGSFMLLIRENKEKNLRRFKCFNVKFRYFPPRGIILTVGDFYSRPKHKQKYLNILGGPLNLLLKYLADTG